MNFPRQMYLWDTDHIGIIQRKSSPELDRLWARMRVHSYDMFFVSTISFHEQFSRWLAYLARSKNSASVVRAYF
jgi:hypothetical protein